MPDSDASRFDEQAAVYDRRAGIPEPQRAKIAQAFVELVGASPGDVLVELGAGTGQLGVCFAVLGLRYIGLDASSAMLEQFERRRATTRGEIELICADVNRRWPIAAARFVFSSRAAHLFDAEHVVAELERVARVPGAALVLGRIEREPQGLRSVLRREMRERLRARGFAPNDGNRRQRELLDVLVDRGAHRIGPRQVASWTSQSSAGRVLEDWRDKPGLGGLTLPGEVRDAVLAEVEAFALSRYGSLERVEPVEERYVLEGVHLEKGPASH